MDRRRRWRSRRPGGRATPLRAGVTALAVLVGTAAMALLLASLSHLAWPPVLVAILGTVPALYLGWLAVPGVISPPGPGPAKEPVPDRLAGRWNPVDLGVHQVIGGGPMPAYIRRPHDELLWAVLDPTVRASRLVVLRGRSSTGKTRAAYEAVAGRLADWRLDYPLDPAALAARLEAGIPARTVLWLGELRQYADADGGAAVLGRLADLVQGEGYLAITTMWPEHWTAYTAAARGGPGAANPAGTAGRLLERLPELSARDPAGIDPARGGVIDVPDQFTAIELEAAATAGDPVLAEAAGAAAGAGQDGQVTQYLAGVPDLLRRYAGPGGDPYGQAIITAAMDVTRLGYAGSLPAALLQEAAVGYLTGPQRTRDIATWRDSALAWATAELNGAVRALQPVPPAAGTGVAGYQVADYLDQHGRRTRQDQLGPASLWDALTAHAFSARDLTSLGQAAADRGLYRYAAALWTTAAARGHTDAARQLVTHLRQVNPGDTTRAARWAASQASLDDQRAVAGLLNAMRGTGASDAAAGLAARAAAHGGLEDPHAVGTLLEALREAGDSAAIVTLLARDPASHVTVDPPLPVAGLLRELSKAGDSDAVTALATRSADHTSVEDPWPAAWLLESLQEVGASDAATALAARAAAHCSLDHPWSVGGLLDGLVEAGASEAIATLLARNPADHVSLDDPAGAAWLLESLQEAGASDAITTLAARAAAYCSLDEPWAAARVLEALREAGASDAIATLLARDPAAHASLDRVEAVTYLLEALREAGASDAVTALLARNPADHATLDDPENTAWRLRTLRAAGDSDAVTALLARNLAAQASLDNAQTVADLVEALREAGASDQARTLAGRAADAGMFGLFVEAYPDEAATYLFGREPDGTPSQPWTWQEPGRTTGGEEG